MYYIEYILKESNISREDPTHLQKSDIGIKKKIQYTEKKSSTKHIYSIKFQDIQ